MNVQEYIRKHSLETLISTYKLRANYHRDYPNLVQLCYHQLDTPQNDLTKNCRGLILDTADDYRVVSFPFTRFGDYSYNNPKSNKININNCRFYEKIDGSIITMYWYDNKWNISTKGLPDASGVILGTEKTYNDYFWEVFRDLKYSLPTDNEHCYIFEFKFPSDHFLVKTEQPSITLIGIRNLISFEEVNIHKENITPRSWNVAPFIPCANIDLILERVRYINPIICEGYVAVDMDFNRVKIKSPQYENINLLNHKNQTHNRKRMLEIIRTNTHNDFLKLEKFSLFKDDYYYVCEKYQAFKMKFINILKLTKDLQGRELGLALQQHQDIAGLIFAIRNNNEKVDDMLYNTIDIKKLSKLVGI